MHARVRNGGVHDTTPCISRRHFAFDRAHDRFTAANREPDIRRIAKIGRLVSGRELQFDVWLIRLRRQNLRSGCWERPGIVIFAGSVRRPIGITRISERLPIAASFATSTVTSTTPPPGLGGSLDASHRHAGRR